MKNRGFAGVYIFFASALLLAVDGVILYLGATALGTLLLLSSLLAIITICFWVLRLSDNGLHSRGVLSILFLILFIGTVFKGIGATEHTGSYLKTNLADIGNLITGQYVAILLILSLFTLAALFAATASLERRQ